MKKIIILSLMLIISIILVYRGSNKNYIVVPDSSIRFRIIPNSNTVYDQNIKEAVKDNIVPIISEIESSNDINETRLNIINSVDKINDKINEVFESNSYDKGFKINYGINYFPEKVYKGIKYNEGNYESMVIEIGEAKGDNYWCVLFPPLCMMENTTNDEVEYKFLVSEIIKKFIKRK